MRRLSSASNPFQQVQELRDFASKQFKQNLEKYNKLKQAGVSLSFAISIPTISKKIDLKPNQMSSEKLYLESTVNQLMKDQELLTKQERKHIYEKQSQNQEKKEMGSSIFKAYSYLRSVWTQFSKTQNEPVDDHLDRLNKIVAVMKGGLQRSYTSTKSQKPQLLPSQQLTQSPQYQSLLLNYERLQMKYEDTVSKYQQKLRTVIQEKNRLEKQNAILKKQQKQIKNKQLLPPTPSYTRPTILSPQVKSIFQNSYFKLNLLRTPTDDSSIYKKSLQDLKSFISNYSEIKQQKNSNLRTLNHARSQQIIKIKFQRTKSGLLDNQKLAPEKFYTKIQKLHPELKLT